MFLSGLLYFVAVSVVCVVAGERGCDRGQSRLVRKVVYEKLMPAFSVLNTELSDECVFSPVRDRYRTQETHKSVEDGTKWYCHFCGKAFMTEYYLDLHFDNRHTDQMEEENSLCLADVCEVFRCDVIGRVIVPDYWDVALCLEDDMKSLHRRCSAMVKSCVPSGLTENETRWLTDITMQELCSYLTCSKYWEVPFDLFEVSKMCLMSRIKHQKLSVLRACRNGVPGVMGLYIIMTVLILFGVVIYYAIFYTYFYTDTFSDSIAYNPTPKSRHSIKPYQPDLRHRPRSSPARHPD